MHPPGMEIRFYHLITFDWILAVEIVKKSHTVPRYHYRSLKMPHGTPLSEGYHGAFWGIANFEEGRNFFTETLFWGTFLWIIRLDLSS